MDLYEFKLQELREKYKSASSAMREIIIRQARAIQIAKEKSQKRFLKEQNKEEQLTIE